MKSSYKENCLTNRVDCLPDIKSIQISTVANFVLFSFYNICFEILFKRYNQFLFIYVLLIFLCMSTQNAN